MAHAHQYTEGKIICFPGNIRCDSPEQVIEELRDLKLITGIGDGWLVSAEGYKSLCISEDE
ncbi:hypothetical protein [Xanthomonas sp. MUS 060]|uniref:hypothetical protein n=1 Tax=Xanthomonas sp. MUS 060 TaxID=1588031 RepID=UPI0005F2A83B|nr:hypothetical protein [Xanthomonas sp. MUS 060]